MSDLNSTVTVKRRKASLEKRKARSGYFFVAPFLIGLALIYIPMLIDSIWLSFSYVKQTLGGAEEYVGVGFENYVTAFTDKTFVSTLISGLQQLVLEVPAIIVFSLFIAVVLNQKMLGRAAFRAIFFVPVILSAGLMETINANDIVSGAIQGGVDDGSGQESSASQIISVMDFQALFANMKVGKELVTYVVDLVNSIYDIINDSGVQMLIFLAGLQSISPAIYEAAQIEGATGWETFWKITFPMISPMILVNAVYTLIDAFTKSGNSVMSFIDNVFLPHEQSAMYWIYFGIVMLLVALVAAVASTFIFYQRKD
ncbi:MAG: sugar ABC transporter permease [Clostridia bacterium]|nr:sugar ABC transporter permease [Clostridia bacterium]